MSSTDITNIFFHYFLGANTFSQTIFSIMTIRSHHYNIRLIGVVTVLGNVAVYVMFLLRVILLSFILLSVILLSVIMPNVILFNVIIVDCHSVD
jgi:hypothetical protein